MRIGHGYDAHRFVRGEKLILGGMEIEYDFALLGHSDADVLIHAVIDALLGAAALGDIGMHFPASDPVYKDISSLTLLKKVCNLLNEKDCKVVNLDATVIAQAPRLGPLIPQMRKNIADCLKINIGQVSIKATTEEGMGFTGKMEGISAHCICLLEDI